jgi:hypothetical protein
MEEIRLFTHFTVPALCFWAFIQKYGGTMNEIQPATGYLLSLHSI